MTFPPLQLPCYCSGLQTMHKVQGGEPKETNSKHKSSENKWGPMGDPLLQNETEVGWARQMATLGPHALAIIHNYSA